jgi:ABC-2 type transport system permease protein
MRGLLHLTWLEIKIFLREPLGAIGSVVIPVAAYVVLGRVVGGRGAGPPAGTVPGDFVRIGVPVFAAVMIMLSSVLSLVTIIAIYRESGILKRLRATPLRPWTILTAHVLAKLLFTAATLLLMVLAGKRYYPVDLRIPVVSFTIALVLATWSTLSIGFVVASVVRTARFAQPAGALIFYPMVGLSGLFFPIAALSPGVRAIARVLPLTFVVSLLTGILRGDAWSAHVVDVAALVAVFAICMAVSAKVFRWE